MSSPLERLRKIIKIARLGPFDELIKKILEHLGLWEEAHAPADSDPARGEITLDLSYSQSMYETLATSRREAMSRSVLKPNSG